MEYKHIIEYDVETRKILIFRLLQSGEMHFYTEIPLAETEAKHRSFKKLSQVVGEALLVDMSTLRDLLER